ncbi:hypothetical protein [Rhodopirellula baltica]
MFRRFVSSLFPSRANAERDVLMRLLTVAGMIEHSPHGYSVPDLAADVGDYLGASVTIDAMRDDLDLLETVGVIREDDGVWTWDCIGVERNQVVVSRLSAHVVG